MMSQAIAFVLEAGKERTVDVTLEDDARYEVILVDDVGLPVEGIVSGKEVSDAEGGIHVPAGEALSVYEPFHSAMYLSEPTGLETVDPSEVRLRPGGNRVRLERTGRIAIRLDPEPFDRCRKFEFPRIRLTRGGAAIDDPRVWFSSSRQALVIDGVPPGRHDIRLETFGPYLATVIEGVDVRPHDTTWTSPVVLVEGATVIVASQAAVDWRSRGWAMVCEFIGGGGEAAGKSVVASWIDDGFILEGVPPGSGLVQLQTPEHYDVRLPIAGLTLGETRKVAMELERYPRVRGRVVLPAGASMPEGLLWLRFQPFDDGEQPRQGEEGLDVAVGEDGSFEAFLRDGSHRMELLGQEDPRIKDLPRLPVGLTQVRGWKVAGAGRVEVVRGRSIDGLEVPIEPAETEP
jgi:hypothetical protein